MKFWAKVNLKEHEREDAAFLLMRFFDEFNPESSICFKGKEAKMEIVFEEPPQGIIKALSYFCDGNLEFYYGKNPEEYENGPSSEPGERVQGEEATELPESEVTEAVAKKTYEQPELEVMETAETKTSEQLEKEEAETSAKSKTAKKQARAPRKAKEVGNRSKESKKPQVVVNMDVPDLIEFAKKSTSYEAFVDNVVTWLDMGKREVFFRNLITAAEQAEEITWKELTDMMNFYEGFYTAYDKIWCGQHISGKFKESDQNVTTLTMLKAIVSYKNFEFQKESAEAAVEEISEKAPAKALPEEIPEDVEVISAEAPVTTGSASEKPKEPEEFTTKNRVRLKCMMGENPDFEGILGSVDKTKPIEERVKYVLTAMGWTDDENNKEHQQIFKIANAAVRLRKMQFEVIYSKANISNEEQTEARMTFSKFINSFLIREPYRGFKVHLSEFLRDLQSVIMLESEIEAS